MGGIDRSTGHGFRGHNRWVSEDSRPDTLANEIRKKIGEAPQAGIKPGPRYYRHLTNGGQSAPPCRAATDNRLQRLWLPVMCWTAKDFWLDA